MNDELVPFSTGHFGFFYTVAMQQTLGNKNQFVKQAIKQHEQWCPQWMSWAKGHSHDIQYNWQLCISQTVLSLSFHSDWAGYPKNKVRWYVRMSLRYRQFMVWLNDRNFVPLRRCPHPHPDPYWPFNQFSPISWCQRP